MQKQLLYGKEARDKIKAGVDKVSNMVKVTLGAMGKNVIIKRTLINPNGGGLVQMQPKFTKDGVSVARSITLDDAIENVGADAVKVAAEKTMQQAGDGTTTTCILVQAIVEKGLELIDNGANSHELKSGIDKAVEYVVEQLKEMAIPIADDNERIRQVATVSANNDVAIGQLIADAYKKIGTSGVINIEESKGTKTEIKIVDGFQIDNGYMSDYFITNQSRNECELINPYILLYDKKLTLLQPLQHFFDVKIGVDRPLVIICEDADGEAFAGIAMNSYNQSVPFKACIVRAPFGDKRREIMEDLAAATGGYYISDEKGTSLERAPVKYLGNAQKAIITKDSCTIIGGDKKAEYDDLVNDLKMNLTQAKSEEEKEETEKRIARLTGGVAIIYIGGATEIEMRERKDRLDDAIRATKAAIEEGFVAGGGSAFFYINFATPGIHPDGYALISNIVLEPFYQICRNAGVDIGEKVKLLSKNPESPFFKYNGLGYNAKTDKVENLIDAGIIDPVKVLRCALQNAASAATMILISEGLICDTM